MRTGLLSTVGNMKDEREEYVAVPDTMGGHLYFPASVVTEAVNREWEPVMQRAVDSAGSAARAALNVTKLRSPHVTARVLANAYAKLIESGKGVSRERAAELASRVLDPKGKTNGTTEEGRDEGSQ